MAMTSPFLQIKKFLYKSTVAFLFVSAVIAEDFRKYRIYGNIEIAGMREKNFSTEGEKKTSFLKKIIIF